MDEKTKNTAIKMLSITVEIALIFPAVLIGTLVGSTVLKFVAPSTSLWIFKTFGREYYRFSPTCMGLGDFETPPGFPYTSTEIRWYCLDLDKVLLFMGALTLVIAALFEELVRKRYLKPKQA